MSKPRGNHEITKIVFTKGKSLVSLVGPALGSGANGETVALLKSDEVTVDSKIEFIKSAMAKLTKSEGDQLVATELMASLVDLQESLTPATETEAEDTPEVVDPSDEGETLDPATQTAINSADPALAPEAAPVVAEPQPTLVIKSQKEEEEMTTPVDYEALYKAQQAENAENAEKLAKFVKAEEARELEECLVKAKGVSTLIGDDNVEPLARALATMVGVEAMEPIFKAIEAAGKEGKDLEALKKADGHSEAGKDDEVLNADEEYAAEYETIAKAAKEAGEDFDPRAFSAQARANIAAKQG